ncbi:hypothetical protein BpHYR1_030242 [Brachionus plicatilis]|uniref:Uncharacterized protein n=1 Tax=Brachionus plicatilis TaxID=10195 RepID=A0A3M7RYX6_BRAPC|nr:hypothetical protein BpHYR1_030242 [Brachionus plicatilis]
MTQIDFSKLSQIEQNFSCTQLRLHFVPQTSPVSRSGFFAIAAKQMKQKSSQDFEHQQIYVPRLQSYYIKGHFFLFVDQLFEFFANNNIDQKTAATLGVPGQKVLDYAVFILTVAQFIL